MPGTSVTGVVTGSVPTGAISAHIRQLLTGLGGTSAVVYEVATSHVLAVSWNESVLDYSRYNISMANPIIDIKTLDTISGSFAVRTVIAALGGSSAFTAATISAGLRDTSVGGFFVSVRDVKAPNVAGLALRTLTVVPMTPAEAATTIASRVAYDIGQVGDAVAVFASTWAANGGFPADTNKLPQQLFDVMQPQMPLLAELCLADNSLSPFAFTCLTEFTYPTNNLFHGAQLVVPLPPGLRLPGRGLRGHAVQDDALHVQPAGPARGTRGAVANAGQLVRAAGHRGG